ncbi:MAG: cell division protein FtsZ [Candidatus Aquirickettsiella gammari]|uniref:Cell division protein FtsZ n=1 Tax=Candidatus Aquirickettsiella gammari TaxID=2016198 RepID=A0A370CIH0_9COXI|nr:MAG: cell division protein FtsZ [Candidatus Aquirickettsiella gammari]
MSSQFDLPDAPLQNAVIKVIGVGGGGGNALEHMLAQDINGVEFICANTDAQALRNSSAKCLLQLGQQITKGLGAGANPEVGRLAAEADRERIRAALEGANMVFITAGMGGGTGTGAAPVVAEIAKQMKILTVAVVTKPFSFEGKKRLHLAEEGIKQLSQYVDSLITIPNNKLMNVLGKNVSLLDAFKAVNDVLFGAVKGIAALITRTGLINVDFADVKTVMSEMGMAMMGTGIGSGSERARLAAESAIGSPLLEDIDLAGARGVLVNITAGPDLSMGEFGEVGEVIKSFTSEEANVVIGTVIDPEMADELRVTVVVTGLGHHSTTTIHGGVASSLVRAADGSLDYHQLERPTILRKQGATLPCKSTIDSTATDIEYFDIPAFLRRQEEVS